MRHRKRRRNLSRATGHRESLIRNLARSVILNRRIETTLAKAKRTAPFVEKLITLSKDGSLHSRRRALSLLHDKEAVSQLFKELAPNYSDVNGGYTRVLHLDKTHLGDNAPLAILELAHLAEGADEQDSETESEGSESTEKADTKPVENAAPEAEAKTESAETETAADDSKEEKQTEDKTAAQADDGGEDAVASKETSESDESVSDEDEKKESDAKKPE